MGVLIILFTYFWLGWVFAAGAASRSSSLIAVRRLPLLRSSGSRAHGFQALLGPRSCSSRALELRLSSVGSSLSQGSNLCLLQRQADSLLLSHQGSPEGFSFVLRLSGYFVSRGANLSHRVVKRLARADTVSGRTMPRTQVHPMPQALLVPPNGLFFSVPGITPLPFRTIPANCWNPPRKWLSPRERAVLNGLAANTET